MADEADDALLARVRAGDDAALEALLARYQAQVYRFGRRMCRDPEDARDVLQETLLAAARGVHDFRGASSLSTWLYTVARSFCIKQRRRSKFAPAEVRSLDADDRAAGGLDDPAPRPDQALADRQVARALEQAIAALAPPYREVLVLRDVEGLTAPEVAEVLGVGVAAVKSRLHRARAAVRERLAPLVEDAAPAATPAGTCPDIVSLFSRHLEGDIDPEACARMERHLAACGRCRGACDALRRTLELCRTRAGAIEVPAAVQAEVRAAIRALQGGA